MNAVAPGLAAFPHRLANANAADTTFGDLTHLREAHRAVLARTRDVILRAARVGTPSTTTRRHSCGLGLLSCLDLAEIGIDAVGVLAGAAVIAVAVRLAPVHAHALGVARPAVRASGGLGLLGRGRLLRGRARRGGRARGGRDWHSNPGRHRRVAAPIRTKRHAQCSRSWTTPWTERGGEARSHRT